MLKLYSMPGCPMCDMLAAKLDAAKLEYVKITGQDVMKIPSITHVPMLQVDDQQPMGLADAMIYIKGVANDCR